MSYLVPKFQSPLQSQKQKFIYLLNANHLLRNDLNFLDTFTNKQSWFLLPFNLLSIEREAQIRK